MNLSKLKSFLFTRIVSNVMCSRRALVFTLSPHDHAASCKNIVSSQIDCTFRFMGRDDIQQIMPLMQGAPQEVALKRWDAGDICLCGFVNGSIAHIKWLHIGPFYIRGLGYSHDRPPDCAYSYNAYNFPAFRGRGIYKASIQFTTSYLFQRGISELTAIVMADNAVVLHTLPSLGWQRSKSLFHCRLFGIRYTSVKDRHNRISRHLHIRTPRDQYII